MKANEDYLRCKRRLDEICEIKANGVKVKSKWLATNM